MTTEQTAAINKTAEREKVLGGVMSNAAMAARSTKVTLKYVKDKSFKDLLTGQAAAYDAFIGRVRQTAALNGAEIKEPGGVSRFFVETSIKLKLMRGADNTKIAEMMIKGTTMGVIDLARLLKRSPLADDCCLDLAKELLRFEEDKLHALKYYL